jgi:hypothetical protein
MFREGNGPQKLIRLLQGPKTTPGAECLSLQNSESCEGFHRAVFIRDFPLVYSVWLRVKLRSQQSEYTTILRNPTEPCHKFQDRIRIYSVSFKGLLKGTQPSEPLHANSIEPSTAQSAHERFKHFRVQEFLAPEGSFYMAVVENTEHESGRNLILLV